MVFLYYNGVVVIETKKLDIKILKPRQITDGIYIFFQTKTCILGYESIPLATGILLLIALLSSECSDGSAQVRRTVRAFAARIHTARSSKTTQANMY